MVVGLVLSLLIHLNKETFGKLLATKYFTSISIASKQHRELYTYVNMIKCKYKSTKFSKPFYQSPFSFTIEL